MHFNLKDFLIFPSPVSPSRGEAVTERLNLVTIRLNFASIKFNSAIVKFNFTIITMSLTLLTMLLRHPIYVTYGAYIAHLQYLCNPLATLVPIIQI